MLKFHLVSSIANPIAKDLRVFIKDGVNKSYGDFFCVAGWKNNLVALQNGWTPHSVFVKATIDDAIINQIKALAKGTKIRWIQLGESVTNAMNACNNGNDVFFYYAKDKLAKQSFHFDQHYNYALCDHIQEPNNLGAIVRNAAAFNIKGMFCLNSAALWNPKLVRASAGSLFSLPISIINQPHQFFDACVNKKMILVATSQDVKATPIAELTPATGLIIAFGNEGHGLSEQVRQHAKQVTSILINKQIESLNVAAASAIIFYELQKRCPKN